MEPSEPSIRAKETLDERQEITPTEKMAAFAFTFTAWSIKDCMEEPKEAMINVRSRNKRSGLENESLDNLTRNSMVNGLQNDEEKEELDTLTTLTNYWGAVNPPPMVHISMSEEAKNEWRKSYQEDAMFRTIVNDVGYSEDGRTPGRRFFVDKDGMVFFSVCRSSSLDRKYDRNRTEPNRKRPDRQLLLH